MIPGVGRYSTLITPKAGSLFHAVFQPRRLGLDEMSRAAVVHRILFDAQLPWLSGLHTPDEDQRFYQEHAFSTCAVLGPFEGDARVGIIAFREGWIDQLDVLPCAQSRGIGTALLEAVRVGAKNLSLWHFRCHHHRKKPGGSRLAIRGELTHSAAGHDR